ncbi:4-hydroxy-3-methylbut-2-enyl diphosphate reductase [Anaeromyxobacter paludicola]|uniref:4-hydroxy-3-methylbut-2-enyl diphosphate reductase n=1 Tax=Anaeromyxobacter paludicola TaxID=2918171 RepID=A0ABM7X7L1_9BACT|nr:4-hydroxy-3-methylbut-2-enyl diphosphate reductase [Anaeromyxobacter paludicola]BDG07835.1 4-hydroxy-3-methylbut-2-enyl diphosphate reductase [Anaeromyxobacter paludicola]
MEVKIARTAGFCWGVRRTMDKVDEVAASAAGPVVTLGPIIHNPQAVARMREKGVGTVAEVQEVAPGATVVVRTHGAVRTELERARARGLSVVDGTCPYVKFPQVMAQRLTREGYHLVVVGDANHAEVKGVVSFAEGPCTVMKPGGAVPEFKAKRVAVIAQTTCIGADFERAVGALALRHQEVRAVNTICSDTDERQADARALASEVDAVVVVGGKNSANTRHLAEICREIQPRTWHVETEDELDPSWFTGCTVVGLSAGASTPDWVIEGVAARLRDMR